MNVVDFKFHSWQGALFFHLLHWKLPFSQDTLIHGHKSHFPLSVSITEYFWWKHCEKQTWWDEIMMKSQEVVNEDRWLIHMYPYYGP